MTKTSPDRSLVPAQVTVIGVPLDMGADRRGTDMGPSAIRYAGLRKRLVEMGMVVKDVGNIETPVPESIDVVDEHLRFMPEILRVCERLAALVDSALQENSFPLVLGGDHSLAIGTLAGIARRFDEYGVIWLDAHGDFNTHETSPSGNIHGMGLSASVGLGAPGLLNVGGGIRTVRPEHVAMLGVRDLDPGERDNLRLSSVTVLTIRDIDEMGIAEATQKAIAAVTNGNRPFYLSIDMDVLDPGVVSGLGTPVPGGLTYREAHLAVERMAETGLLLGMELAEVNPIMDTGGNKTARLAVELACTALGKRIL